MTPGTYEIKNKLDGMAYGGRSGEIERRWQDHRRMLRNDKHHCEYFQNAWNKYGKEAFEFIILEVIEDPGLRLAAEQIWLDIHHANKACYNSAITAGPGGPLSEETRRKIGDAHRGKKHTAERKQAKSERMMGSTHTDEWKQAHGEFMMGNQYALGHVVSDTARRKIGKASKGKELGEETRRKIGVANAKPYPAFIHRDTGEVIPAGVNLNLLCRERRLYQCCMQRIKSGKQLCHKGWMLLVE